MATQVLIVVVVLVTCNLAILYLPFDKKMKALLGLIVAGVLVVCCLSHNAQNNDVPVYLSEKIAHMDNKSAQRSMMATFNISEEKLSTQNNMPTPIELGVTIVLVLALVSTPMLLSVAKDENENTAKKVHDVAFFLNMLAGLSMLSLYYGLKLPILPWNKKALEKGKTLPMLT